MRGLDGWSVRGFGIEVLLEGLFEVGGTGIGVEGFTGFPAGAVAVGGEAVEALLGLAGEHAAGAVHEALVELGNDGIVLGLEHDGGRGLAGVFKNGQECVENFLQCVIVVLFFRPNQERS